MKKILCIDIGNTNTKLALFATGGEMSFIGAIKTDSEATWENCAGDIIDLFRLFGVGKDAVGAVVISSVVPRFLEKVRTASKFIFNTEPLLAEDPEKRVGADIYCIAEFVRRHYELPAAVFSLGTATTVIAVNERKELIGGMIIPGVISSLSALARDTATLPQIAIKPTEMMLSITTHEAINNGIIYGTAAMLDGLAAMMTERYSIKTLMLGGGLAGLFKQYTDKKFIVDEHLVLKGAYEIYEREKE
ncbi:MAG: type III pantothenate kinase [Clostridiales bacterium]|jgi:type III pantothenate kinase|nr:type III pantothenate kinase [Clostridiales bacterium]